MWDHLVRGVLDGFADVFITPCGPSHVGVGYGWMARMGGYG